VAKLLVEDLTKSFGDVAALSGVSFALAEREFLSLLGPSGCGKTTVLRLIAGFEEPDRGEISLDGQRLRGVPPELRKIGFVFQNYALFPHMTVAKNVAFGIRFQRGADPRQRTAELLEKVGLAGLENRRPSELSAGQRQRVALARALAPAPRLLLLDEPLSALDAKLRESLREELRHLQRELGVSTLYVTHDQEEALALSDRIVVMNTGRIEQIGIPAAIYARPETPFVAAFIGRTNRLAGEVVSIGEEGVRVRVGESLFLVSGRRDGGKGSFVAGDRVVLYVKEERLRLDGRAANRIPATGVSREYRGDCEVVHLESRVGPLLARADVGAGGSAAPHELLEVSFAPEDAVLFCEGV
jgi:thiamine transport system ATP-binding protein